MDRLSEQVIRAALVATRDWDPSIKISVNISPTQFSDGWLAERIVRILTETAFPADRLVVEITESSLFGDIDLARNIIASLKNQGIRLALDDFGTGFSSLSHLRQLHQDRPVVHHQHPRERSKRRNRPRRRDTGRRARGADPGRRHRERSGPCRGPGHRLFERSGLVLRQADGGRPGGPADQPQVAVCRASRAKLLARGVNLHSRLSFVPFRDVGSASLFCDVVRMVKSILRNAHAYESSCSCHRSAAVRKAHSRFLAGFGRASRIFGQRRRQAVRLDLCGRLRVRVRPDLLVRRS